jgi:hypothetical protein
MNKKVLSISITTSFVFLILFSTSVVSESVDDDSNNRNFIGLQSLVKIDWDEIEPIIPRSGAYDYNLYVTYEIITGMFLSDLILKLNTGKQVDINLDVVDISDGCQVTILNPILSTVVSEGEQELSTKFSIAIDETVPAYSGCYATINATVEPIKGPLGILTLISGFQKEITITFEPAYLPLINADFLDGNLIEISPFNETEIPISIENLGNDRTKVIAAVEEYPENWNVSISDVIVDVGNTTQTYLTVTTDNKFDEEMIVISLTPVRALNENDRGSTQTSTLILENDGSYKEKEENEMSATLILLVAVILLILIIFVLFLVVIRKKE